MSEVFTYEISSPAGEVSRGELEAESRDAAYRQLKNAGAVVLEVENKAKSRQFDVPGSNRIKPVDLSRCARQLSTMISSGMTLLRALETLAAQTENPRLVGVIAEVQRDVEAGASFSVALERHQKVFGPLFIAMIRAGEVGGVLERALEQLADQLEKDTHMRRQVRGALVYPSVIIATAAIVMVAIISFVVPTFEKTFDSLDGELPGVTKGVLAVSDVLTGFWFLLFPGVIAAVVLFVRWRRTASGRSAWQRLTMRLPLGIGSLITKVAIARWSSTLSSLIGAGVPLLESIEVTAKAAGNVAVEKTMVEVRASVERGGTLAAPLREASVFPAMVAQMVAVGEQTGALEEVLAKVASSYEEEVEVSIKSLMSIIEPVLIVGVGSLIAVLVAAMYLPLFEIYKQVSQSQ